MSKTIEPHTTASRKNQYSLERQKNKVTILRTHTHASPSIYTQTPSQLISNFFPIQYFYAHALAQAGKHSYTHTHIHAHSQPQPSTEMGVSSSCTVIPLIQYFLDLWIQQCFSLLCTHTIEKYAHLIFSECNFDVSMNGEKQQINKLTQNVLTSCFNFDWNTHTVQHEHLKPITMEIIKRELDIARWGVCA